MDKQESRLCCFKSKHYHNSYSMKWRRCSTTQIQTLPSQTISQSGKDIPRITSDLISLHYHIRVIHTHAHSYDYPPTKILKWKPSHSVFASYLLSTVPQEITEIRPTQATSTCLSHIHNHTHTTAHRTLAHKRQASGSIGAFTHRVSPQVLLLRYERKSKRELQRPFGSHFRRFENHEAPL